MRTVIAPGQLALDLDALDRLDLLADRLAERLTTSDGAGRLVREMVRRGLPEELLLSACALALELDQPPQRRTR